MKTYPNSSQKSREKKSNLLTSIEADEVKIHQSSRKILFRAIELAKNLDEGKLTFNYGGRPVRATNSDIIRVVSEWPQSDLLDLSMRNIILSTIMSLEQSSPTSGYAFLSYLGGQSHKQIKTRSSMEDILFLVRKNIGRGICEEIVSHIFENISTSPSIEFILSKEKPKFVVTSMGSFAIKGHFPQVFNKIIRSKKDIRILFIDGAVERVSEIDKILQDAASLGINILLMARQFSPDVSNTLLKNYETLNVIPFEIKESLDFIDLAIENNIMTIDNNASLALASLSIEDIEESFDVIFENGQLSIVGVGSLDRHIIIEIPKHFHKQAGIIEDRIKVGMMIAMDAAKFGVVLDENSNPICSLRAYQKADAGIASYKNYIENIGCIVNQEK